jgi:hypothetical protein
MSDWTKGYTAALADVAALAHGRGLLIKPLRALLDDMEQDARVIAHEQDNGTLKRRLAAAREALPLFDAEPAA